MNFQFATNLVDTLVKEKKHEWALLIAIGIASGGRISELLALKKNSFTKPYVILNQTKTGQQRVVKLSPGFWRIYKKCLPFISGSNYLFYNKRSKLPYSPQWAIKNIKHILISNKFRKGNCTSHTLRKTYARKIYEDAKAEGKQANALVFLMDILGHKDLRVTLVYIGITQEDKDSLTSKIWL